MDHAHPNKRLRKLIRLDVRSKRSGYGSNEEKNGTAEQLAQLPMSKTHPQKVLATKKLFANLHRTIMLRHGPSATSWSPSNLTRATQCRQCVRLSSLRFASRFRAPPEARPPIARQLNGTHEFNI